LKVLNRQPDPRLLEEMRHLQALQERTLHEWQTILSNPPMT
jgi:hypothetical protein